jgi:hypothetical protein
MSDAADKVFDELGDQDTFPSIPAGAGTETVWRDIEKAYDVDYRHNKRLLDLSLRGNTGVVQTNQAQMLGLILLTEAGYPLQPNGAKTPVEAATGALGAMGGSPAANP